MTTPATSPSFALTAIQQVLTEELGTNRTIASGTLANWGVHEGMSPEQIGRNALIKPQIKIRQGALAPIFQNGIAPIRGYSAQYVITLYHFLENPALFQDDEYKSEMDRDLIRDANIAIKALGTPRNLAQTIAGDNTGLSSGALLLEGTSAPSFDLAGKYGYIVITMKGFLWVSQ